MSHLAQAWMPGQAPEAPEGEGEGGVGVHLGEKNIRPDPPPHH